MTCMVATMGGDWAQKICEQCYGCLVHEQRKPTREAREEARGAREEEREEGRRDCKAPGAESQGPDAGGLRLTGILARR